VPVHRRDGADEGVDADLVDQQPRRLMEVVRHIVDDLASAVLHAALDQRPLGRADEHAVRANAINQLIAKDRLPGDSGGLEVIYLQILDPAVSGAIRQRLQQRRRLGHRHAH
jgi:hypothetical protein